MNNKGQCFIEWILTYGLGVLLIAVIISILFTVFSGLPSIPSKEYNKHEEVFGFECDSIQTNPEGIVLCKNFDYEEGVYFWHTKEPFNNEFEERNAFGGNFK